MLRKLDRYWENINVPTLPQTVGKWKNVIYQQYLRVILIKWLIFEKY